MARRCSSLPVPRERAIYRPTSEACQRHGHTWITTIADSLKRRVLDKTGLGLQGYYHIREVESLTWGSEEQVITKLNFVIHDTSANIVAIHALNYSTINGWRRNELTLSLIPVAMQDVIREGFEPHR
ncbi:Dehydrogenase E1 component [Penicillium psychrosexuale]|uniref:Dehydrogenase E1 component n=1 Tax=Penicillium psychrosexuale TaxID=1002107 RepID=UPI00254588E1|nr:Dehydrogenase E1 component [Penicillium psychrosexuale]KAJ5796337.1 Dehydrogenase E1 component [Penicillium psychrosexuale]